MHNNFEKGPWGPAHLLATVNLQFSLWPSEIWTSLYLHILEKLETLEKILWWTQGSSEGTGCEDGILDQTAQGTWMGGSHSQASGDQLVQLKGEREVKPFTSTANGYRLHCRLRLSHESLSCHTSSTIMTLPLTPHPLSHLIHCHAGLYFRRSVSQFKSCQFNNSY